MNIYVVEWSVASLEPYSGDKLMKFTNKVMFATEGAAQDFAVRLRDAAVLVGTNIHPFCSCSEIFDDGRPDRYIQLIDIPAKREPKSE